MADPARMLTPALYEQLLAHGFRRSGDVAYRPACPHCNACVPVRIPLDQQTNWPRRHRRNLRNNADCRLLPVNGFTEDHRALYERYLRARHPDTPMADTAPDGLLSQASGLSGVLELRADDDLIGFSVVDRTPRSWSAVYTAFEPDAAWRGPGTFAVLAMAEQARLAGAQHLYLGYWIAQAQVMAYKGQFRPLERLGEHGWTPM